MTDVADLINFAANSPVAAESVDTSPVKLSIPEQKMQDVQATADAKRVALGGIPDDQTFKNAAIARVTGSGVKSANPIEHDLATLSWGDIERKYGADAASIMVGKTQQIRGQQTGSRSLGDEVHDIGTGVGLGLAGGAGGIAALGLSGLDKLGHTVGLDTHMGVWAADKVKQMNEAVQSTQSPLLQMRRQANQEQSNLDTRDSTAQYEKDVAAGDSKLFAGLKQIGRDTLSTAKETIADPTLMADLAANAGGSILLSGPLSKGIGAIGSKVIPAATQEAIAASKFGKFVPGQMGTAVGLQEGASAYQQTAAEVANMKFDDLEKNSPYYRDLVAKGMSPEDARAQAADHAGMMAGALAAPTGVLGGKLTEGFLEHPLVSKSAGHAIANVLKETGEEAVQGATGQLSQNLGTKTYADENKNLAEGVGQQIAQGALGGGLSAGGMQAPSLAVHGVVNAGNKVLDAGSTAVNKRADAQEAANQAKSPASDANISAAGAQGAELAQAPETVQALADAVTQAAPEDQPHYAELADKITKLGTYDPKEFSTEGLSNDLKTTLDSTSNRPDALLALANEVNTKGADTKEGLSAARELDKQIAHYMALANSDQRAFADIPDESPAGQYALKMNELADHIEKNPTIDKARNAVRGLSQEQIDALVKPSDETSPQTQADNVAALASISPDKGNLEAIQLTMNHAKNGKVHLTQEQHQALLTSMALLQAAQNGLDRQKELGHSKLLNSVSEDVMTKPGEKNDKKRSAKDYAQRIFNNMRANNTKQAAAELKNFGNFVTHMTNKADAVNQHYTQGGGDKVEFQARNPENNRWYASQAPAVHPHSQNSVELAQRAHLEAKRIAEIYNGLSQAFPELNGGEKTVNDLHENLQGKPSVVAEEHRTGKRVQPARGSASSLGSREATAVRPAPTQLVVGKNYIAQEGDKPFATAADARQAIEDVGHDPANYTIEPASVGKGFFAKKVPSRIKPEQLVGMTDARLATGLTIFEKKIEHGTASASDKASLEAIKGEIASRAAKTEKSAEATPGDKSAPPVRAQTFDEGAKAENPTFKKFDDSTGTLGIPREEMPQVKTRDHGALTNFLNAKGIEHETTEVPSGDLKPTQAEYSPDIVDRVKEKGVGDRSVIVSEDNHVIDGHHQWLAAKENGEPVKAIVLKTDVHSALEAVHEFPSAKKNAEGISTGATPASAPEAKGAEVPEAPKTIHEAFPNLHGAKEGSTLKNKFLEAFHLFKDTAERGSRLFGLTNPAEAVQQALSSDQDLAKFMGENKPKSSLPTEVSNAYQWYTGLVPSLRKTLEERLAEKLNEKGVNKQVAEGSALLWEKGRVFNLLEQQDDGTFRYNDQLAEQALLAGLHWLLNTDRYRSQMDPDYAASITRLPATKAVRYMDMLDMGLSPIEAASSLGDHIKRFWGLKENDDAGNGWVDGIPQAMAKEVMRALEETLFPNGEGLLQFKEFVVENDMVRPANQGENTLRKNTLYRIVPNMDRKDVLFAMPGLIEQAALKEPTDKTYFTEDKIPVAKTQMHQSLVQLTAADKAMVTQAQKIPHQLNTHVFTLFQALGLEGLQHHFGGGDLSERKLNKQDLLSLEGKNNTVRAAWREVQRLVTEMDARPEGRDSEIFYQFGVSSVGRLQMLGGQTPQGSKLVRAAILPTWSTIDVRSDGDGNKEHMFFFNVALAQALGVKVHQLPTDQIMEELNKRFEALSGTIEILQDHLSHPNGELSSAFDQVFQDEFAKIKEPVSFHALQALLDHARWLNASEEERQNFKTSIYIEADGVTNGVANALRMYGADDFTKDQIENFAKTGQFFGVEKTLNDYRANDKVDLYGKAAVKGQAILGELWDAYSVTPGSKVRSNILTDHQRQMQHTWRLLDLLVPGFDWIKEADTPLVTRNVVKNPMMQMVYGAGQSTVTADILDSAIKAFYAKLSEAAELKHRNPQASLADVLFKGDANASEKYAQFMESLNALLENGMIKSNGELYFSQTQARPVADLKTVKDLVNFEFDAHQLDALHSNVQHLFVSPMYAGIADTMGKSVMDSSKLIQNSTNIQSIVLEHAFKQAVEQLQEAKKKADSYSVTDGLSKNELKGIMNDLLKKFPLVETGKQSFLIAKNDKSELKQTISSDLNGRLRSSPQFFGPSAAGVKGGPTLNIGLGDGNMIQHMVGLLHSVGLPVFDGFNFGLDKIAKGSVQANQAAFNSFMGNPLRAVLNSFKVFNANLDPKLLEDPKLREDLGRAFGFKEEDISSLTPKAFKKLITAKENELSEKADMVDARRNVMRRLNQHIDQMAAAQRSYFFKGGQALTGSFDEMAKVMSSFLTEELAKIQKGKPETPALQIVEPIVKARADKDKSEEELFQELERAPTEMTRATLISQFSPEQERMWHHIVGSKALDGWQVKFGTTEGVGENTHGYADFANRVIQLVKPSAETFIHEAIHVATMTAMVAHYQGKNLGEHGEQIKNAMARLEALKKQFMGLDANEMAEKAPSYFDAIAEIASWEERAKQAHDPEEKAQYQAAAMNEFMTWALANKELVDSLKSKNSIIQMGQKIWQAIKDIVFRGHYVNEVTKDMYSNIAFNAAVLIKTQPTIGKMELNTTLFQSAAYGSNDRLTELNKIFGSLLAKHLKPNDPRASLMNQASRKMAADISVAVTKMAQAQGNGFAMTQQQKTLFNKVVQAMVLNVKMDPNALAGVSELYQHVVKQLTPEMLIDKNDPDAQRAENIAQTKFDVLMGHAGTRTDEQGRSTLLPVFMGLALVDNGLRAVLQDLKLPKAVKNDKGTIDAWMENLATDQMQKMSNYVSGMGKAQNVGEAIDNLTQHIADLADETSSAMEQALLAPNTLTNQANDAFVAGLERITDNVIAKAKDIRSKTKSPLVNRSAEFAQFVANMVTMKNGAHIAEGAQSAINRFNGLTPVRELISDIIGRTSSNASVYDLIKQSNSMIGQVRQQFRKDLPEFIAKQFTRPVTQAEYSAMHMVLGKADLAAIAEHMSPEETINLVTNASVRRVKTRDLENQLRSLDPKHFDQVKTKAQQLANYMITGKHGTNLLRNANAVSKLLNEPGVNRTQPLTKEYVAAVDQLTTLYALDKVSPATLKVVSSLVQDQRDGVDFVLNYLRGQRAEEVRKSTGMALNNAFKGYIPSLQQQGVSLVVADDTDAPDLLAKSYVRLGDYKGSKAEGGYTKRGYYFAPVSSRAAFSQGIMQNANQTAGGVEISTGRIEGLTGGVIFNPAEVARITKRLHLENGEVENLLPVFDEQNKVVAYERAVDPERLVALNQDTHIGRMIGVWRGRQTEEAIAQEFNNGAVDELADMYGSASSDAKKNEYEDLFASKDPVIKDAVSLLTKETKDYIRETFGDRFMVRKDMINDVIGYRKATVGDAWTGNTRWDDKTQTQMRRLAMAAFGNDAYKKLVNSEELWQDAVKEAKNLIIVKSIIVPTSNFLSNLGQLMTRGIPMTTILKAMPRKIAEAEFYTKGRLEMIEAEALLRKAEGAKDLNAQHKLKARIQAIEDAFTRLSIYPLIKAGEFGAVSHRDISRDDLDLVQGRLHTYIAKLTEKLPDGVKKAGRYALISKDTALFQGLEKAVEYGDFLAKAIQYDHHVQKKGLTSEQALGRITEEYVNYDRLPGRFRGYGESMGMWWFTTFKIRSTKVALSILRENPLQALMHGMVPLHHTPVGTIGNPLGDNIVTKALNGSLKYSLGPGMMFHAPMLHPVGHLLGQL